MPHRSTPRLPHVKDVVAISLTPETGGSRMSRNMRAQTTMVSAAVAFASVLLSSGLPDLGHLRAQQTLKKVDMGDYEPVVPWPKPLPDTDLSHDGWTWGSG